VLGQADTAQACFVQRFAPSLTAIGVIRHAPHALIWFELDKMEWDCAGASTCEGTVLES
jgi:hypothetical protein